MSKIYVIPVESTCNADCPYCVNQFRNLGSSFLHVEKLEKCLGRLSALDAIEISGGGEPTLHPEISNIINLCASKARTQMYSNGELINLLPENTLRKLSPLCISRAHYDSSKNRQIMGIDYSDEIFSRKLDIKLSAVLFGDGINSPEEARRYIAWARGKAGKVVFRPLFEDVSYPEDVKNKFVALGPFADYFGFSTKRGQNILIDIDGIEVEFEVRSCGCENTKPILHANGKLNYTWDSDDTDRKGN